MLTILQEYKVFLDKLKQQNYSTKEEEELAKNEYAYTELLDENSLINLTKNSKKFDVVYPSIGENLSFLKRLIKNNDLDINFITRNEDEFCWKFSNKGYFNFKSNIPIILSTFKLN